MMVCAVLRVRAGEMGYKRTAKYFCIPKGTLEQYVKDRTKSPEALVNVSLGIPPVFQMCNFITSSPYKTSLAESIGKKEKKLAALKEFVHGEIKMKVTTKEKKFRPPSMKKLRPNPKPFVPEDSEDTNGEDISLHSVCYVTAFSLRTNTVKNGGSASSAIDGLMKIVGLTRVLCLLCGASPWIFTCENRAGRYCCLASFHGYLPFPQSFIPELLHTRFTHFGSQDLDSKSSISLMVVGSAGMKGWEKREIPEKSGRPVALYYTIPTCGKPGATWPGIEPGSSRWEARRPTAQPPRATDTRRIDFTRTSTRTKDNKFHLFLHILLLAYYRTCNVVVTCFTKFDRIAVTDLQMILADVTASPYWRSSELQNMCENLLVITIIYRAG
ncbi:hypothetical protein PR048_005150 [Dryococelus australis]|uniref:HTH psq-type domain-containing protein n=1 Tax=Dryococelus australis TaxID=614101 RepID=A0ABQ9I8G7_9NEOP|nr:hypothetical protein PR048_005150 [Dryococelus australis]